MSLRYLKINTHQAGAALLVTVIIMLALTVIALAATSNNQLQQKLIQAQQLNLTVFNAGMAEIDAQIAWLNQWALTQGAHPLLHELVKVGVETQRSDLDTDQLLGESLAVIRSKNSQQFEKRVSISYQGMCPASETERLEPLAPLICHRFALHVVVQVPESSIASRQTQILRTMLLGTVGAEIRASDSQTSTRSIEGIVERVVWSELQ